MDPSVGGLILLRTVFTLTVDEVFWLYACWKHSEEVLFIYINGKVLAFYARSLYLIMFCALCN